MRVLFGCDYLVASGGLLRLERVGHVLRGLGHATAYLAFSPGTAPEFSPACPVYSYEEAASSTWDAVLIPGAGFSDDTVRAFARLRSARFGVRVQMILSDQHMRPRFLAVNSSFTPDMVLFNNRHWPAGSYREFRACRFHHLVGAVDTRLFHPSERPPRRQEFVIGAQIAKNPAPLIASLEFLPANCVVRCFGFDRTGVLARLPRALAHRVEYVGPLFGARLAEYYRGLDVMVSTEAHAGWANVVAEAMACGVPAVTTPAGTLGIAENDSTALVVERATPAALAQCILRLLDDPLLGERLAANARANIERYDWQTYSTALLNLLQGFDGVPHYTHAPTLGLFGKAPIEERLDGLNRLLALAPSLRNVLDVGAAEGVLAGRFLLHGAARVDAWEFDAGRVSIGHRLFGATPGFSIRQADLTTEADIERIEHCAPPAGYDLVLYLGVHHHLPQDRGREVIHRLLSMTGGRLALRTTAGAERRDRLCALIRAHGFEREYSAVPEPSSFAGPLHVFKRMAA